MVANHEPRGFNNPYLGHFKNIKGITLKTLWSPGGKPEVKFPREFRKEQA